MLDCVDFIGFYTSTTHINIMDDENGGVPALETLIVSYSYWRAHRGWPAGAQRVENLKTFMIML